MHIHIQWSTVFVLSFDVHTYCCFCAYRKSAPSIRKICFSIIVRSTTMIHIRTRVAMEFYNRFGIGYRPVN